MNVTAETATETAAQFLFEFTPEHVGAAVADWEQAKA
jgi:hypothetical protein